MLSNRIHEASSQLPNPKPTRPTTLQQPPGPFTPGTSCEKEPAASAGFQASQVLGIGVQGRYHVVPSSTRCASLTYFVFASLRIHVCNLRAGKMTARVYKEARARCLSSGSAVVTRGDAGVEGFFGCRVSGLGQVYAGPYSRWGGSKSRGGRGSMRGLKAPGRFKVRRGRRLSWLSGSAHRKRSSNSVYPTPRQPNQQ